MHVTELEPGDRIRVEYRSTHADRGRELTRDHEVAVTDVDIGIVDGYPIGEVYINVNRDEDDTLSRRRVTIRGDVSALEVRRTTINGPEWQRISQTNRIVLLSAIMDSDGFLSHYEEVTCDAQA